MRGLNPSDRIRADICWIISDHTFLEPLDATDGPATGLTKLRTVLEHSDVAARLLIARPWGEIALLEQRPTERIHKRDIIDHAATHRMRDSFARREDWLQRVYDGRDSRHFVQYREAKARFLESCDSFADSSATKASQSASMVRSGKMQLSEWVRQPGLVNAFLAAVPDARKYKTRAWRKALACYPDRQAMGRWVRLMAYYAMLRVLKRDHRDDRFANNFEDATYAFLSSFAGSIATNDAILRDCSAAVFPWVTACPLTEPQA
jgi:hypothetical protein